MWPLSLSDQVQMYSDCLILPRLSVTSSNFWSPNPEAPLLIYDPAVRALQNPELFKYEHFRQAALAVAVGVIIQLIIQVPVR